MQKTAASAVKWCEQKGGHIERDDMVSRIANLGSEGKYKANIERDFHTLMNSLGCRLGAKISAVKARTSVFKSYFCLDSPNFKNLLICAGKTFGFLESELLES